MIYDWQSTVGQNLFWISIWIFILMRFQQFGILNAYKKRRGSFRKTVTSHEDKNLKRYFMKRVDSNVQNIIFPSECCNILCKTLLFCSEPFVFFFLLHSRQFVDFKIAQVLKNNISRSPFSTNFSEIEFFFSKMVPFSFVPF